MVFGQPDRAEAELLGLDDEVELVAVDVDERSTRVGVAEAEHQPKIDRAGHRELRS